MVTLQDVSSQLMKPAKDLADWNFPLSQILEKYYALLEQPYDINFGNAGLVIENSTSVYGRRVDHLSERTLGLNLTIQHEDADSANTERAKKKSSNKLSVDLDNFVLHDLTKEIGKNINFKDGSQKPVKLISRRFPQLESSLMHLRTAIDIVDISGEIIGKKYDFRCNEYFDVNGMLVYECTDDDFKRHSMNESSTHQSVSGTDPCIETDSDPLDSSGYYSCTSTVDCSHISNEDCNDCSASICDPNNICFSSIAEEDVDYDLANADSDSFTAPQNANADNSVTPNTNENNSTNNLHLSNESSDESHCNESVGERETELPQNQNTAHVTNNDSTEINNTFNNTTLENPAMSNNDLNKTETTVSKTNNKNKTTCNANVDENTPPQELLPERRRSKRISSLMSNVREMESKAWKPIPLTKGVPSKPAKKRAVFKLPCQISSSKSITETRKRKMSSESQKSECLAKFYLEEYELPNKKVTMYSPSRLTFTPLKEEELDEFQKSFDDCFKNAADFQQTDFEAVTNITMDLLGFQPSYLDTKRDPMLDNVMYSPDLSISDNEQHSSTNSTAYSSLPPYSTPEMSPSSHSDLLRADSPPILPNSSSDYQKLIENRIKEIFDESDVRTDLEEAVAKWHSTIKPKLAEAERRKTFSIRDYSSRILNILRTIERRKCTFNSLVEGQEPFEVARYFSALLQLANTNNVDIGTNNGHVELVLLRADLTSDCTEEETN